MLAREDTRRERLTVVTLEDGYGGLRDDRAGVGTSVDQMHGAAGDARAVMASACACASTPGKAGRRAGWMFTVPAVDEGVQEDGREQAHEAGQDHDVDRGLAQGGDEGGVEGGAVGR